MAVVLERILFMCGCAIVGLILARLLRQDDSIGCLLCGLAAGAALPWLGFDTGIRASSLQDLVFLVILPVLIFEASWQLKPDMLRHWLLPLLLLAIPGVILFTLIAAAMIYFAIDHPSGFPWLAGLLAAAILSATDPSVVSAKLRGLDAPDGLATLIEGENLLNDASAVLIFSAILMLALGQANPDPSSFVPDFLLIFFGGAVVGIALGLLTTATILFLSSKAASAVVIVFSALLSSYVAEDQLGVSGIMAVTSNALLTRYLLTRHSEKLVHSARHAMDWIALLLQALLFTLLGLVVTWDMFGAMWLAMLIGIAAAILARFASVFCIASFSGLLSRPIPWRWSILMSWGGLRGAVAIALVLALPTELPYWWVIQSMVFAVVLFSLFVQAPSCAAIIRRLRLQTGD